MNLKEELLNLIRTRNSAHLQYAVCGGLAMTIHGFVRSTVVLTAGSGRSARTGAEDGGDCRVLDFEWSNAVSSKDKDARGNGHLSSVQGTGDRIDFTGLDRSL